MKKVSDTEIDQFISSLFNKDNSVERRAFAHHFISKNRKEIDTFLEKKIKNSGASLQVKNWAKKVYKLMEKYADKPLNNFYDEYDSKLVSKSSSFNLSTPNSVSFTFDTAKRNIRVIGYIISFCLFIFFIYLCYSAYQYIVLTADNYTNKLDDVIPIKQESQ